MFEKIRSILMKEKTYINHWFEIDERIRFVVVAIGNMLLRYLIFVMIGVATVMIHYQAVLALSWLLSSVFAFMALKWLVFKTEGSHLKEYGRSLLVWTLSYLINAVLLGILVREIGVNVYLSQAVVLTLITILNYLLFKHFAFRQTKPLSAWERAVKFFNVFSKD